MKYRARKTLNGFLNSRGRCTLRDAELKIETIAEERSLSLSLSLVAANERPHVAISLRPCRAATSMPR